MQVWRAGLQRGFPIRVCGLWLGVALAAQAGNLGSELERAMARRGTHADTAVIVRLTDPVDLQPFAAGLRAPRDNRLLQALKARAAENRARLEPLLITLQPSRIQELWLINAVAMTVPAIAVKQLLADPAVARVDLDSFVQGGRAQRTPLSRTAPGAAPSVMPAAMRAGGVDSTANAIAQTPGQPDWNLQAIHVPELWALGYRGQGVVVATMDTGADLEHPDLSRGWRGGANSWFDPHGEEATPYDALGHGTQALGILVGSHAMGVAPDAQWISARLYNGDGRASMADIHLAFQWLMDPDGDPSTPDAPDVVNASWSLTGRMTGSCSLEFAEDIRALRGAGIAVVFAAGNDGPKPATSNSPGNNPGVVSVGAMDQHMDLARATSRGPSACGGAVFPSLLAPGVNIPTTDLSHGGVASRTAVSGSSMAAPHVAGVMALLMGAFPSASVAELEAALLGSSWPGEPAQLHALSAFKALQDSQAASAHAEPSVGSK
jgi:subtilisin family serine protease